MPNSTWRLLLRCYRYLLPYRRIVGGAYGLMVVINLLNVLVPQLIRWIIDQGIDGRNVRLLSLSVGGLLALTALKGLLVFFQGKWTEISSQSVAYDLRNAIQTRLLDLSFAYHDRSEAGQLLSRVMQDAERVRFLTGRATWRIVDGAVLVLITAVALLWMNPRLALLALLTVPLLVYRGYVFGRLFRPLSMKIQNQLGTLTTRLEQNLRGARIVKAFAQENAEIDRFLGENERWFSLSARAARIESFNVPLMDLVANIGTVAIIWYGGVLVIRDQLTLGELVAFTTYLAQLANPVRTLGRVIPILAIAASSAERIFQVLDAPNDVTEPPNAVDPGPLKGRVQFDHVSFAYPGREHTLTDIDFVAEPGQIIALLGATGSGKSTVINLIPRFYDPSAGGVLVDGHDLRALQRGALRRQIGIVLQESTLFAASIRENIAFGRPEATEEEVEAAARAAQAHEFITTQLQDGYDTLVGERGITLSGGQKQRMAIARALLTDPRILILDDATASVDTETEQLIQRALTTLMAGRTTFVIAHRLSTVRRANLILVLEQGRIVARGSHQELLANSPRYAEVYRRQLRDDLPQVEEQR